jgi:galactose mutarotase-like enzyme
MSVTIQNNRYSARIAETGAELKSLVDRSTGKEYIWQADPAWWAGSAPVLFPVIGGLKGGAFTFEGRLHKLPSHGFARTSEFRVAQAGAESVSFELSADAKTREMYPFEFLLRVSFALEQSGIAVRYDVSNRGTGTMWFSIGSHPAFNLPFAGGHLENYYVVFEREENMERWFFKDGMVVAGKTAEILTNCRTLSLSRAIFDQGPVIFKHPESREFTIVNSRNSRAITVATEGVPYVAVWAKPNGAPFLCIEPWHGIPDMSDCTGNLMEKEGIMSLGRGATFTTGYRVEIS